MAYSMEVISESSQWGQMAQTPARTPGERPPGRYVDKVDPLFDELPPEPEPTSRVGRYILAGVAVILLGSVLLGRCIAMNLMNWEEPIHAEDVEVSCHRDAIDPAEIVVGLANRGAKIYGVGDAVAVDVAFLDEEGNDLAVESFRTGVWWQSDIVAEVQIDERLDFSCELRGEPRWIYED